MRSLVPAFVLAAACLFSGLAEGQSTPSKGNALCSSDADCLRSQVCETRRPLLPPGKFARLPRWGACVRDPIRPVVVLVPPSSPVREANLAVSGRVLDNRPGARGRFLVDGVPATNWLVPLSQGEVTATVVLPTDGTHTIVLRGRDAAGNETSASGQSVRDSTPPTLALTPPTLPVTTMSLEVHASAQDLTPPISLQFELDGQPAGAPFTTAGGAIATTVAIGWGGQHVIRLVGHDALGNEAAVETRFFSTPWPVEVFVGTGDHFSTAHDKEPLDSEETVRALFEWISTTYGAPRVYWRGAQETLWDTSYGFGNQDPSNVELRRWLRHLLRSLGLNALAVHAAHDHGSAIFAYTGLHEHGAEGVTGVSIDPGMSRDTLLMEHPEWAAQDRFGERLGTISFSSPGARAALVERYVQLVRNGGYDGLAFYSYVENYSLRYLNEFDFSPGIVERFEATYPPTAADAEAIAGNGLLSYARTTPLPPEASKHLARVRGTFLTEFMGELHTALLALQRPLTLLLNPGAFDSGELTTGPVAGPDYAQGLWSFDLPATGWVSVEWSRWICEGLIDEFWVQDGDRAQQMALLDRLLARAEECHRPLGLRVRTRAPFDHAWRPYVEQGVVPVAVITTAVNGIEWRRGPSLSGASDPTLLQAAQDADWRTRVDALQAVTLAAGPWTASMRETVLSSSSDPHVLVRRKAVQALGHMVTAPGLGDVGAWRADAIVAIEHALGDTEHAVRLVAAVALGTAHSPESARLLLEALGLDGVQVPAANLHHQFRLACIESLKDILWVRPDERERVVAAIGNTAGPTGLREAAIRVFRSYALARAAAGSHGVMDVAYASLLARLDDATESPETRVWALITLGNRSAATMGEGWQLGADVNLSRVRYFEVIDRARALLGNANAPTQLQVWAATILGLQNPELPVTQNGVIDPLQRRQLIRNALWAFFLRYGDSSTRSDRAWGFFPVGRALAKYLDGTNLLVRFRDGLLEPGNRWVAWNAYRVLSENWDDRVLSIQASTLGLIDEASAISSHAQAPLFPGHRSWGDLL